MPLRLFLDRLTYRGVPRGLGNSQSYDENIFRVDNLARGDAFFAQQIADDAETENIALAIRFVDERDYNEVSLPSPPRRRCWKKNRPSLFHLKNKSEDYSSSEAESSSEEYKYEAQSPNRSDNFAMPTLKSKVMVNAILAKVPALAPAKVQAKESSSCCRYCRIIFS